MQRKTLMTVAILIVMLVSLFGTVAAQTGVDPATPTAPAPTAGTTPTPAVSTTTGTKFFTHPVVLLISKYFSRDTADSTSPTTGAPATAETPAAVTGTPVAGTSTGTETPAAGASAQDLLAQQIAAYHEDGMGFGVLVKIYAMAEASKKACPPADTTATTTTTDATAGTTTDATAACTPVSADELVEQFKSGTGMGQLFKEYGKPDLLGVGHVKKEMKKQPAADGQTSPTVSADDQQTDDTAGADQQGKGNGNSDKKDKSEKDKQNNGNGNGNGNSGKSNGNGKGPKK